MLQALRSDKELNKATKGLRVLVGDKIKDASDEIMTTKEKQEKKKVAAAKAQQKGSKK